MIQIISIIAVFIFFSSLELSLNQFFKKEKKKIKKKNQLITIQMGISRFILKMSRKEFYACIDSAKDVTVMLMMSMKESVGISKCYTKKENSIAKSCGK